MAGITALELPCKSVSENVNCAVSFVNLLDSGELLTGTPTIVEVTTSDLTLSNKVVNTAQLTINGETVAIGQAVQFHAQGGTAGTDYDIRITATTDSSPAQTRICRVTLPVVSD